jgi:PAS domain S-box-containing protein
MECGPALPPWGRAAALLARDEGLQAVLQTTPLGVVIIHRSTHVILHANQKALAWLGREPETLLGRPCHGVICPALPGACPVADLGQPIVQAQHSMLDRQGQPFAVTRTVSPCRLDGEEFLIEWFERSPALAALRGLPEPLQRQHELILGAVEEGIICLGLDGRIGFMNAAASRLLGVPAADWTGKDCRALFRLLTVAGQPAASELCPFLLAAREGRSLQACCLLELPNGTILPAEFVASPLHDGEGIDGVIVLFHDRSVLRQREDQLRASEDRYRRMVESLTNYVYAVRVVDGRAVQTTHSEGCLTVTGYSARELYEDPMLWLTMVHPDDREEVLAHARELAAGRTAQPIEHRIIHKSGEVRWVRNTPVLHWAADGTFVQYTGLVVDITDRKKASEQILQMNAELERRVKQRTFALQAANLQLERLAQELAEMRRHENLIGFEIQKTLLLGTPPKRIGWARVAATTLPTLGIDGDFYDFYVHGRSTFDVLFGDVMGKGVPAALVGAAAKSQFQRAMLRLKSLCLPGQIPTIEAIVGRVHAEMTPQLDKLERFLCLHLARFDLHRRSLELANCGHTLPLHRRAATGQAAVIAGGQHPLGLDPRESYRTTFTPFEAGDLFLFYSDGVTDARNPDGEFYGLPRLTALLERHTGESLPDLLDRVVADVLGFMGRDAPDDDLSLVAVAITRV